MITLVADGGVGGVLHREHALVPQRPPRHVEQVGHARVLQDLEGQRTRVQQRRETGDRRDHVRHDAECAADRGDDAGPSAARDPGRKRIEHTGARRRDDDQRCQQKLDTHSGPPGVLALSA